LITFVLTNTPSDHSTHGIVVRKYWSGPNRRQHYLKPQTR